MHEIRTKSLSYPKIHFFKENYADSCVITSILR